MEQIIFLIDVARYKESTIPLALFDTNKKISLDFLFITADKLNYSDPGVIRVYDVLISINYYVQVSCRCNETHTGLTFSLKQWCTLGEVKFIRQVSDVRSTNSITTEHTSHLEVNMNDKRFEFCTKTLEINVTIYYTLHDRMPLFTYLTNYLTFISRVLSL